MTRPASHVNDLDYAVFINDQREDVHGLTIKVDASGGLKIEVVLDPYFDGDEPVVHLNPDYARFLRQWLARHVRPEPVRTSPPALIARMTTLAVQGPPGTPRELLKEATNALFRARADVLEEAATYAEFYASERLRLGRDTFGRDPLANGGEPTEANLQKSEDLARDGIRNAAAYEAGTHIAEHLRALAAEQRE